MEMLFPFDKPATGNKLLGRKEEIQAVIDTLTVKQKGVAIYAAPKSGKNTVVREALHRLKTSGWPFRLCEIDFFNVRTLQEFIDCFKRRMLDCYEQMNRDAILPFTVQSDNIPDAKVLDLPSIIARESGATLVVYLKEFQNVISIDEKGFRLEDLVKTWLKQTNVRYIITGSAVNTMKSVFEEKQIFYYLTDVIELKPIPQKSVVDYITSSFLNVGRVIERDDAEEVCRITGCNMWYVKMMCSICYTLPIGYVNRSAILQTRDALLQVFAPQFRRTMLELTPNQINFLRAICEGARRLSSSEILARYHLNSSANVFRLKDAFRNKELVTFDRNDEPQILDPVFEYWLKNKYFKQV